MSYFEWKPPDTRPLEIHNMPAPIADALRKVKVLFLLPSGHIGDWYNKTAVITRTDDYPIMEAQFTHTQDTYRLIINNPLDSDESTRNRAEIIAKIHHDNSRTFTIIVYSPLRKPTVVVGHVKHEDKNVTLDYGQSYLPQNSETMQELWQTVASAEFARKIMSMTEPSKDGRIPTKERPNLYPQEWVNNYEQPRSNHIHPSDIAKKLNFVQWLRYTLARKK